MRTMLYDTNYKHDYDLASNACAAQSAVNSNNNLAFMAYAGRYRRQINTFITVDTRKHDVFIVMRSNNNKRMRCAMMLIHCTSSSLNSEQIFFSSLIKQNQQQRQDKEWTKVSRRRRRCCMWKPKWSHFGVNFILTQTPNDVSRRKQRRMKKNESANTQTHTHIGFNNFCCCADDDDDGRVARAHGNWLRAFVERFSIQWANLWAKDEEDEERKKWKTAKKTHTENPRSTNFVRTKQEVNAHIHIPEHIYRTFLPLLATR